VSLAAALGEDLKELALGLRKFFSPHADLLHRHDGSINKTDVIERIHTLAGYADASGHEQTPFHDLAREQ